MPLSGLVTLTSPPIAASFAAEKESSNVPSKPSRPPEGLIDANTSFRCRMVVWRGPSATVDSGYSSPVRKYSEGYTVTVSLVRLFFISRFEVKPGAVVQYTLQSFCSVLCETAARRPRAKWTIATTKVDRSNKNVRRSALTTGHLGDRGLASSGILYLLGIRVKLFYVYTGMMADTYT